MEKNILFNGDNLKIKVIDKKFKNTLICIHGFSSNGNFIGNLDKNINGFNIVSISYNTINNLSLENVYKALNYIIKKKIKHTKKYILAHSLGGYFASRIAKSKKIKGVYFLNPIHPYFLDTKRFQIFKNFSLSKYKLKTTTINLIIKMISSQNSSMMKLIDKKSNWFNIVLDLIKESDQFQDTLTSNLRCIQSKSTYIISKKDNVIFENKLKKFIEENKMRYYQINYLGHSPLSKNSEIIVPYLSKIKSKKRWFFKNIIKWDKN